MGHPPFRDEMGHPCPEHPDIFSAKFLLGVMSFSIYLAVMAIRPPSPKIYMITLWTALVALVASLWLGIYTWHCQLVDSSGRTPCWVKVKVGVLLAWTLVPPILLRLEYFFTYGGMWLPFRSKADDFDEFKYGQDLSSKVWLAISTALLVLYFGKGLKP